MLDKTGDAVGKRHQRIRARSATGQVAGAANELPGLNTTIPARLGLAAIPSRFDRADDGRACRITGTPAALVGSMTAPVITSVTAAEVKSEQVRWLSRLRIPAGELTIPGGAPGRGKTQY